MAQRYKFSIESKSFPLDISGEPIFSFAINYEYIIRNKNKPTACQYRTDRIVVC